jgi:hypothetical protein
VIAIKSFSQKKDIKEKIERERVHLRWEDPISPSLHPTSFRNHLLIYEIKWEKITKNMSGELMRTCDTPHGIGIADGFSLHKRVELLDTPQSNWQQNLTHHLLLLSAQLIAPEETHLLTLFCDIPDRTEGKTKEMREYK